MISPSFESTNDLYIALTDDISIEEMILQEHEQ